MKINTEKKKLKLGLLIVITVLLLTSCTKERVKTKVEEKSGCYQFASLTDSELESVAVFLEKEHTNSLDKGLSKIAKDWVTLANLMECVNY